MHPGLHADQRHVARGNGSLIYDYNLIEDGYECNSNPCLNGGSCIEGCSSYSCSCPPEYTGNNCQEYMGMYDLNIYVGYGRNLANKNGSSLIDPYMEFIAIDRNGTSVRLVTTYKPNNRNPSWNEDLHFGSHAWSHLLVRVYDYNSDTSSVPLSKQQKVSLSDHTHRINVIKHRCYRGRTVFAFSTSE